MDTPRPVHISTLDAVGNLLMVWPRTIDKGSIANAFRSIKGFLDLSNQPMYIVVDLRNDPKFIMSETILNAVKIHHHPALAAWLVVGANARAHLIGQAIITATQQTKIFWFDTIEAAEEHIAAHTLQTSDTQILAKER